MSNNKSFVFNYIIKFTCYLKMLRLINFVLRYSLFDVRYYFFLFNDCVRNSYSF